MFRFGVMNDRTTLKKFIFLGAFVLLFLAGKTMHAQEITPHDMEKLQIMEDSMVTTVDSMYTAFMPDSHIGYSERLIRQLIKALRIPNSYLYPFDKLKDQINIIYADDRSFRIFNWGVDIAEIYKRYYGAVQLPNEQLKLYGLSDYSEKLGKGAEDSVLTHGKWFGALYYRIMSGDFEGQKVYTLFGFSEGSPLSNKKILDPMIVTDSSITFGAPIFGVGSKNFKGKPINRFILEYKKGVQVSLNWDDEKKMIVFDELTSQVNDPNRKYTYVPSGLYDGFFWNNEMWNYRMNLMPIQELQDGEAPLEDNKK